MIYYISDLHLGHDKLIEYLPKTRGHFANADEMNSIIISRWNSTVKHEDIVYFLGDFSVGAPPEKIPGMVASLYGQKHMILGNHDMNKLEWHELAPWVSIQHELYIEDNGRKVWLNHFPYGPKWDKRGLIRPEPTQPFDIALAGHSHDKYFLNTAGSINVGVDLLDFYPKTLNELLELAKIAIPFDINTKLII